MSRIQARQDAQVVRAALPLLILTMVEARESYGYELVERLSDEGLEVTTGLIYPVLTRLERDGLVTTRMAPSPDGPPRKYFAISSAGRDARDYASGQWRVVSDVIDNIRFMEGLNHE
ncbi:PadR family transcriptional regulator [Microbacterium sp. SSW1-49]|uniref:PadR family transcriptional regulator n=1 Tax=Microbacterium croceum TaxID=2851645 RepID=A0ABT0FG73_9MICO|nr:PadR family transcriptional regulator [Microbacterium croceum]MCK2037072.1 PadR family transcriptional regulator [Microbacterium croceum]